MGTKVLPTSTRMVETSRLKDSGMNRPINPANLRKLIASIKEVGQKYAVQVNRKGQIIDGHHRVEACRRLGIKVKIYIDDNAPESIRDFNNIQKSWTLKDYFATGQNKELYTLMNTYGVPANVIEFMLGANTSRLKADKIIAREHKNFPKLLDYVNTVFIPAKKCLAQVKTPTGKKMGANRFFYKCLARLYQVEGVSVDRLIERVFANAYSVNTQGSEYEMLKLIVSLYNKSLRSGRLSLQDDLTILNTDLVAV